ncbi:xanthine phosphoribosyltransferase [Candidatus Odyssella thessalonicensis]|uniref:xanthine phosphoribosyltransferase n=1 Tax=Candidatus Odyssella thessalonicensis TaxID=84647 RepID=UPI000225A9C9|nr:xanthine phosphoribosyltransferase [Candidatus Odyssella thessalonicensis]
MKRLKNILTRAIVFAAIILCSNYLHATDMGNPVTFQPVAQIQSPPKAIAKKYLSHIQIQEAAAVLSARLQRPYKGIVAITRGGMVPATLLAQHLDIRDIRTISIASYNKEGQRGQLKVIHQPDLANQGEGYLFVDDLVDSGETLKLIRTLYPKADFVVLYAKPEGKAAADVFAIEVPQDEWLVFPWELEGAA